MKRVAPELVGPHDPMPATPPRRAGSLRRTTTIDSTRRDPLSPEVHLDLRGRDLFTSSNGSTEVASIEHTEIEVRSRTITSITAIPPFAGLAEVVGASVGNRLRHRVAVAAPDLIQDRPLLAQLLDDVVGASLVGGYALQRAGIFDTLPVKVDPTHLRKVTNVCAGWADTATILATVRDAGEIPTPFGPTAPPITAAADDVLAWHDVERLPLHGMRRLRRLDLYELGASVADRSDRDATHGFDVHFRDSHVDEDRRETVLHEYSVVGSIDVVTHTVAAIVAGAKVLPWVECPRAIGSERRIIGRRLSELRDMVLSDLVGTSTCTHLNDTLRSLAGLDELASELVQRTR